jgi:hypothetical protein
LVALRGDACGQAHVIGAQCDKVAPGQFEQITLSIEPGYCAPVTDPCSDPVNPQPFLAANWSINVERMSSPMVSGAFGGQAIGGSATGMVQSFVACIETGAMPGDVMSLDISATPRSTGAARSIHIQIHVLGSSAWSVALSSADSNIHDGKVLVSTAFSLHADIQGLPVGTAPQLTWSVRSVAGAAFVPVSSSTVVSVEPNGPVDVLVTALTQGTFDLRADVSQSSSVAPAQLSAHFGFAAAYAIPIIDVTPAQPYYGQPITVSGGRSLVPPGVTLSLEWDVEALEADGSAGSVGPYDCSRWMGGATDGKWYSCDVDTLVTHYANAPQYRVTLRIPTPDGHHAGAVTLITVDGL